jgi:hypothetical protein
MSNIVPGQVPLVFPLEVDDGWPPAAVESLPFQKTPDGLLALVAPLFVKDLSVGDLIEAELGPERQVESWRHLARSGHTTIWLLRQARTGSIGPVLARLRQLGCATVSLEDAGAYSVDVPESVPIATVDAVLEELDSDAVAVAFPSLRHPD